MRKKLDREVALGGSSTAPGVILVLMQGASVDAKGHCVVNARPAPVRSTQWWPAMTRVFRESTRVVTTDQRVVAYAKLRAIAVPLLVLTNLAACTQPYSKPTFDPGDAVFPGITSHWTQSKNHDVRVVFVHGMCTHTANSWITTGWDTTIKSYFPSASISPNTLPSVNGIELYDRDYHIGANTISARYLVWSPLTTVLKKTIQFDNPPTYSPAPGEFAWKRASLNGDLKPTLMNDCLADAVIYAGEEGANLQRSLRDAICVALDGAINNGACGFPATYEHGDRRIVIVTESLGSRMVFDAISALEQGASAKGGAQLEAFDEALSPVTEIFMLANQLPLLGLARHPSAATSEPSSHFPGLPAALKALSNARARHTARQKERGTAGTFGGAITLVAFSDPNDLLSYRIPPSDRAITGTDARVMNVIVSNASTYFWYVENPYPAHTGYNQTPAVLRLLFDGSAG